MFINSANKKLSKNKIRGKTAKFFTVIKKCFDFQKLSVILTITALTFGQFFVPGFIKITYSDAPEDIYITDSASGADTGADCANAHSAVWLNTSGNWATPKTTGQIGPGDTVHLCGAFTGTDGQTLLTVPISGSVGEPITIAFETGATLSAAYWGSDVNGAITISSKNYITIDGGTNGIIQNTDNGTALGSQASSTGIYINAATNIEVKNLTIQDIYANGGSSADATDTSGVDTANIIMTGNLTNVSIHDNTLSAARVGIQTEYGGYDLDTISIYNNVISDHSWGISMGSGTGGETTSGINIYNNEITDWDNWQCPSNSAFCTDKTDTYHSDGIFIYGWRGNPITANIYNNYIHGTLGPASATAMIYCSWGGGAAGYGSTCNIFNNLLVEEPSSNTNNQMLITMRYTGGHQIYNNTFVGQTTAAGIAMYISGNESKVKNNIVVDKKWAIYSLYATTPEDLFTTTADCDYNIWSVQSGDKFGVNNGATRYDWSEWQALGYDANSTTTNPNLSGTYYPQATSPGLAVGADLTSVGITALNSDRDGDARPSGSAWDIGAYNFTDITAPNVTAFSVPTNASTLTVDISSFTATDDVEITGYLVTESASAPSAGDSGWSATAPSSYTFSAAGFKTLYAWTKDAEGNVSSSLSSVTTVTLPVSGGGGGGGCVDCYNAPQTPTTGELSVTINQGAETTSDRTVNLTFNVGDDVEKMAISMDEDFTDTSIEEYAQNKELDLCSLSSGLVENATCPDGDYKVYVKFYTSYGVPSQVVYDSITLKTAAASEESVNNEETTVEPTPETSVGNENNGDTKTTDEEETKQTDADTNQAQPTVIDKPFINYLRYGQNKSDVKSLQTFLNQDPDTKLADSGPGAPGHETNFFGPITRAAVVKFQEKYTEDVLWPWGITKGTGFVGRTTLAKINEIISTMLGR